MKYIKQLLILLFLVFNSLYASEELLQEVVSLSKESLYNLDNEQLEVVLKPYIEKHKSFKALVITDNIDKGVFLSTIKQEGKVYFGKNIFKNSKNFKSFKSDIFYDNEVIGSIELFLETSKTINIGLTQEELTWIELNLVKVGVEPWAPVIFSQSKDNINGITGDILKLIIEKSGLKIKVVTDFWDPLLEAFKKKEIDLLPATYFTDERATYGLYSKGYYKMLDYIYVKDNNHNIRSLHDLKGKNLAIPKGFGTIPKIQKKFPSINIVETQDLSDSIIRVLSGEVDALYEGQIAVEYKIQEELITGLKGIPQNDFKAATLHFFSKSDEPLLQSILEKSLNSIPINQINQIKSKWVSYSSKQKGKAKNKIELTHHEKSFLEEHPILKVSSETDYPPYDFFEDNKPVGYSIDILNLISQRTGFKIQYVTDKWGALLEKIKNKEIDIIHTLQGSKERKEYLLFSEGFIKHQQAIFSHDSSSIKSYKDFENKKIGVITGETITKVLQDKNNNFEIVEFNGYIEILKALSFKELDAVIVDLKVGQYTIKEEALFNLRVVSDTSDFDGVKEEKFFKIASRIDYPVLQGILNKGLKSISSSEFNELNQKWFGVSKSKITHSIKNDIHISFIGLMTFEEILFAIFLVCLLGYLGYIYYIKSNILSIKFKTFNILIISFELSMILFLIYEIIKLDRTENSLALAHLNKHEMVKVATRLVQSSNDLTHFVRAYAITSEKKYERNYKSILRIRNGEEPRPLNYDTIYWNLDNKNRAMKHPLGEKISLRSLIEDLPFTKEELNKLKVSEDNSNDLVELEIKAFNAIENNNNKLAIELVHSKNYFDAKQKIMLPIDEMIIMLNTRMNQKITLLNTMIHNQFLYLLIVGLIFILGNILLYILLRKKVNNPIEYLSNTILKIKNEENNIEKKSFYNDEIGQTIEEFFVIQDKISEQTKNLTKQRERFELTVAGSGDGLWEYDYVEDKLWWSPRFIEMLGYKENEIEVNSDTYFSHIHKDDVEKQTNEYSEHLKTDCIYDNSYRTLKKDGSYFWTRVRGKTLRDENGKALKTSGSVVDITELKEAEQEIMSSQERFSTLFDVAPDSISIIKDGEYIDCNQKTLEIFGVDNVEEFRKSKPADYSPKFQENGQTSENLAPKRIAKAIEQGYNRFEWIHKRSDTNEEFDAEVILSLIKLSGESHIYAVVRDISERKKLEKQIAQNKLFVDTLLDSQEQIVITTDGKEVKSSNKAFLEFFDLDNKEEFLKNYDCICDKFEVDETGNFLQKYMDELSWIEYVLEHESITHKAVIKKDGKEHTFTVTAAILPIGEGDLKSAVFTDITEMEEIRKNIEMILSNIMLPVLITSQKTRKILYANEYASKQYESSVEELVGSSIDDVYTSLDQKDDILTIISEQGYVENLEESYKTKTGKEFIGLLSVKPILYNSEDAFIGMVVDITKQKEIETEIREIHKHTRSSIEYASLIQHSLIPSNDLFKKYFDDYFTIWHPKDIVGGDIYLFEELRHEDECLLMVIDCTGHGVPGAFVTMLVKAIERQVAAIIASDLDKEVSPAWILQYFNQTMKKLLKQEGDEAISNAGFDGAVLYYNKKEQIVRFAGAELPLFYIEDGEFKIIKGNRHSIGYKKSNANYEFKEHIIDAKDGMQFYLSTDGYFDQNGGDKGFPFGKKRFQNILEEYQKYSFADQQEVLLNSLQEYQQDEERNDDISVVGIKIGKADKKLVKMKVG